MYSYIIGSICVFGFLFCSFFVIRHFGRIELRKANEEKCRREREEERIRERRRNRRHKPKSKKARAQQVKDLKSNKGPSRWIR